MTYGVTGRISRSTMVEKNLARSMSPWGWVLSVTVHGPLVVELKMG